MFKSKILLILAVLVITLTFSSGVLAADPYASNGEGLSYDGEVIETTPEEHDHIGTVGEHWYDIGIEATNGAEVTLHKNLKSIFTTGYGLYANNASILALNPISISTYGSYGAYADTSFSEGNSKIEFGDNVKIITKGNSAYGACADTYVDAYASVPGGNSEIKFGDNAEIITEGIRAYGAFVSAAVWASGSASVSGGNATIKFGDNAKIITKGEEAYGVYALNTTIALGFASISGGNSKIEFGDKAKIITEEKSAYGVFADIGMFANRVSVASLGDILGSKAEIIFGDEAEILTKGEDAHGVYASACLYASAYYSKIILITFGDEAKIITKGKEAYGVFADASNGGISSIVFGNNASITTLGDEAHAIVLNGDGIISFGEGASITTKGISSDTIYLLRNYSGDLLTFDDMTATSEQSNLIGNNSKSKIEVTFTDSSKLYGDLKGYIEGANIILNLRDTTTWEGNAFIGETGTYNVNLFDTAAWVIKKDSEVSNLNMKGTSRISFQTDVFNTNYTTVTATVGNLNGSGIVEMNVDLSSDKPKGDFLYAKAALGNYGLIINHNNIGGAEELILVGVDSIFDPNPPVDEIPVDMDRLPIVNVFSNTQDLTFTLFGQEEIQVGAYLYSLKQRYDGKYEMEWWLKRSGLDMKVKEDSQNSVIGFGEFAKSIDATLSDEFLKTRNKLWFTSFYKLQKFDEEILNTSFKQQIAGGIAGLDKAISDNFSVGQFFGLNIAYQNIGEGSIGHIASLTTGIYANYINRGFLASGYVRVANYIHDLRLQGSLGGPANGTMNTYGWSASIQLSQKISLLDSGLYVTPKAKVTYTYVKEQSYNVGGMPIQNLDITGFVTWLGARIGMEKNNTYEKPYGYYLEAGWMHDTNPSVTVIVTDEDEDEAEGNNKTISLGNNRFEVGVGFYTSPLGASSFNMEFKYSKGKGIEEPIKVNVGGSVYF